MKLITKLVQKIHDKTEYVLNTTKEDRKDDRRWRRAARRVKRFQQLRNFKPFDIGIIRWLQNRQGKRVKVEALGVTNPLPE